MPSLEALHTNELAAQTPAPPDPLSGNWPQLLAAMRQLTQAGELHSRRLIGACGLTVPQTLVLRAIDGLEAPTVGRISQRVSLSPPTVTAILNRLEERALVVRDRGASDRRQIILSLTPRGRELQAAAPSLLPDAFMARYGALPLWEQTLLLSSLQRLAEMMGDGVAGAGDAASEGITAASG